eukprot:9302394-Ditylum_brightwellii.AAC.1
MDASQLPQDALIPRTIALSSLMTRPKSQEGNRTLALLERSAEGSVAICTMTSAPISKIEPLYADYQDSICP